MTDELEAEADDLEVAREWGPWSVWKTEILLGGYLPYFTRAGSQSVHRTFIDGFAGTSRNIERLTGRPIMSSPRLALSAQPAFTHVICFELPQVAERLRSSLDQEFPGRTVKVLDGNVNEQIEIGLEWWRGQGDLRSGPMFGQALAYLDPNAIHLAWTTVERVASFGQDPTGGWATRRRRPEIIVLFPTGALRRQLPQPPHGTPPVSKMNRIDWLYGDQSWRPIYEDQRSGVLKGDDSWAYYAEHYRWKLSQLGYSHTSGIEVRNTRNALLYHILFATDHDAGHNIFNGVMSKARSLLPAMIDRELVRLKENPNAPRLFEATDAELRSFADEPERWARLLTTPPSPYLPGRPPLGVLPPSEQGSLF